VNRIINGKRYDTETADRVAYVGNNLGVSDFGYEVTHLYRTKKGAWFIAGEGGPRSRWAHRVGNNGYSGGDGLEPLTKDEARTMLEARDDCAAVIERYFADEIEDA
jgi:hypothetical protein